MNIEKSLAIHKRAVEVIPGGAQAHSKYYGRLPKGVAPPIISHGHGCYVWDEDMNKYLDWSAALGPVILGYMGLNDPFNMKGAYPPLLPMATKWEVELAEKLVDIIPCAEMVRFFNSGSDCTSAAVRLARYITGKEGVLCCGYHGWDDWYATTLNPPKNLGIPFSFFGYTRKIEYGDLKEIDDWFIRKETACFILEPMSRQCPERASREYLLEVRRLCDKYGVILIFDEVIMGFRYAMGGGGEYFGIKPDLACFSKAMANGFPLAALVGERGIMQEIAPLQVSGTFYGEVNTIRHCLKTIDIMEKNSVIEHIWRTGNRLIEGIKESINVYSLNRIVRLKGMGPWSSLDWSKDAYNYECYFMQEIFKKGIFYNRDFFLMFSHTDKEVYITLEAIDEIFNSINCFNKGGVNVKDYLEGRIDKSLYPR